MVKVAVCGAAGGIGQPLSLLLKQQLPSGSSLAIYDVVRPILGVGEDLSHISSNVKLSTHLGDMQNPNNAEVDKALQGADVVIIPAGVPRKPGMTRDDLFKINAGIVKGLIEAVARNCPKALIGIITNPVNSTVPVAAEVLKKHGAYDPKRLFGVSTLDITRAKTFIGELKGLDPTQVHVDVIGGHSPETMLTVLSGVKGVSFAADEAKDLSTKIKEAGTAVVNAKEGAGSATLSMAYAGAHFALALVRGLQGESNVVEDSYVDVSSSNDAQLQGVNFLALPVLLGKQGVEKILGVPHLDEGEKAQLSELIPVVKKNIETGVHFVNGA